jgi:endonuclease/exonuclease/phosphatase family metal-dependent hydrolase
MCPAFLPFLEAPLELTVLEWCVGWSATVPEFQGWAGNSILIAATSVLETRNHKRPDELGKHLRWATMITFQKPKTAALTVW